MGLTKTFIPYGHQYIDDEDIASVVDVLKSDWLTQGSKVDEFERRMAEYCDVRYAVAFSSGTAALHAACNAIDVDVGDEVITSPITFAATSNAVLYCGGHPVFADIKTDTFNINPDEIRKCITNKTRAIIPVDYAGHPCMMDEINEIAQDNNLFVIEDACHSLGATYRDRRVGSLADMTIFSFHPVKAITTGEGGMVVTDIKEYYDKLKRFRHHGIVREELWKSGIPYDIHSLGFNYRITDLQCALGISQLKKLDSFIKQRREIAKTYTQKFNNSLFARCPVELKDVRSAYHLYVICFKHDFNRNMMYEEMRNQGICVQIHYVPIYLFSFYQSLGYAEGLCPNAEWFYNGCLSLPIHPSMTDDDVQRVVDVFKEVLSNVEISMYN